MDSVWRGFTHFFAQFSFCSSYPSFVKFELGFPCLTIRASWFGRPKKSRVRPSVSLVSPKRNPFDKIENRTENTENGKYALDRASAGQFSAVFLARNGFSISGSETPVATVSRAQRATPTTCVTDVHPKPSHIYLATHAVVDRRQTINRLMLMV